jgi:hypothetical protein
LGFASSLETGRAANASRPKSRRVTFMVAIVFAGTPAGKAAVGGRPFSFDHVS